MALRSDAAMVLFYDIAGDNADHDYWHSYEHFHERLSVPGFLRATRWVAVEAQPKYMVTYEVSSPEVGTSQPYLDRLNNPSAWTSEIMPRFRGMTRGFTEVVASAGFGLGNVSLVMRFRPEAGQEDAVAGWLAEQVLPDLGTKRGMAGAHLLRPTPPQPMTREQSLRGADTPLPWLLIASAYEMTELERLSAAVLDDSTLRAQNIADGAVRGRYRLHHTATAEEVARTTPPQVPPRD